MVKPVCWIIAGPNGAGKTTFALEYLPSVAGCRNFINADLIAAGLSPLAPERELLAASRIFLQEIAAHVERREDFAFETTLSGRGYLRLINELKQSGWQVELVYLALPSVETSRWRVQERVAHGGHSIPEKDIVRRFPRSLNNLLVHYAPVTTRTRCFYNSGVAPEPIFVQQGEKRTVVNEVLYQHILQESRQ